MSTPEKQTCDPSHVTTTRHEENHMETQDGACRPVRTWRSIILFPEMNVFKILFTFEEDQGKKKILKRNTEYTTFF